MNCPSCSTPLKPGARFCPECGATVTEPPAYTDKTMIASALPSQPGASQPAYGDQRGTTTPMYNQQPPAGGTGAPWGSQPQPGYGQQYQPQQPQQPYGYGQPAYAAPYAAPSGVPASNGLIPALIMLACSLALVASIFIPVLIRTGESLQPSIFYILQNASSDDIRDEAAAASLFFGAPVLAGLTLLCSLMAVWRRRNLWGVFNLMFGLVVAAFAGLLALGASVSDGEFEVGPAIWLMLGAGGIMFVTSIVYLARKKAPR